MKKYEKILKYCNICKKYNIGKKISKCCKNKLNNLEGKDLFLLFSYNSELSATFNKANNYELNTPYYFQNYK